MGKGVKKILLILLTMFAAAAAGMCCAGAGAFDEYYDFELSDGTYAYLFPRAMVVMDENWYQNTIVISTERGAAFYHKASYNAYADEGMEGGRLFTLGASVNSSFEELPSFIYIGFDEEEAMNYYAELPTDYQAYMGDEAVRAEYDELWSGVEEVIAGIQIKGAKKGAGSGEKQSEPSRTETDRSAGSRIESGDYIYSVNNKEDKTITIEEYTGNEEEIEIPPEIDGYKVTDIGYQAFSYKEMKILSVPDGIQSIGKRAFEYCVISDDLLLPDNITVMDDAFSYARMPAVVTIPAGAAVESCAFSYCKEMKQLFIEAGAEIGGRAFGYSDDLEQVVCAEGSRLKDDSFEYCDALKEAVICGTVDLEKEAFSYCDNAVLLEAGKEEYSVRKQAAPNGENSETNQQTPVVYGHSITLTGDEYVFIDCPEGADAGDTVTVHTVDVADGEVKLEVNGSDIGTWEEWGTYTFIMPDEDVELHGWISTEGYPGA